MDTATIAVLIAMATLAVNIGVHVFGGGWNLSTRLTAMSSELRKAIEDSRDEIEQRQDRYAHDVGETIRALKEYVHLLESRLTERVHNFETWSRDEFVRKEGFYETRNQIMAGVKDMRIEMTERMKRIEEKLDAVRPP